MAGWVLQSVITRFRVVGGFRAWEWCCRAGFWENIWCWTLESRVNFWGWYGPKSRGRKVDFFKGSFRVSSIASSKESPLGLRKRYNMLGVHLSLKKLSRMFANVANLFETLTSWENFLKFFWRRIRTQRLSEQHIGRILGQNSKILSHPYF